MVMWRDGMNAVNESSGFIECGEFLDYVKND